MTSYAHSPGYQQGDKKHEPNPSTNIPLVVDNDDDLDRQADGGESMTDKVQSAVALWMMVHGCATDDDDLPSE